LAAKKRRKIAQNSDLRAVSRPLYCDAEKPGRDGSGLDMRRGGRQIPAAMRHRVFRTLMHWLPIAVAASAGLVVALPSRAEDGAAALLRDTHWGESSTDLQHRFGAAAMSLPRPLDFGDSYTQIVLPNASLGGVPVVVFFQMDKATHGLKRIQIERPRHGVNPPAFRAIAAALYAELGRPDQICEVPPVPASGWQAAAEERWRRGDALISAIFRDTTLQAFEGCPFGPAIGWCGLHGQLLVRLGPSGPGPGAGPCG
jgi:hypothetical protein